MELKGIQKHRYSEEERDFLRAHHDRVNGYQELTDLFNAQFRTTIKTMTIADYCHKQLGLKGMKNAGQFVKGSKSRDLPIGTIRKSQVGTYIKVGNEETDISGYQQPNWIPYQRYLYEQAHGPIADGEFVIFLDGNVENFDLSNLAVINRQISVRMAQNRWYTDDAEVTRTGLMCVQLKEALRKRTNPKQKRRKENGECKEANCIS